MIIDGGVWRYLVAHAPLFYHKGGLYFVMAFDFGKIISFMVAFFLCFCFFSLFVFADGNPAEEAAKKYAEEHNYKIVGKYVYDNNSNATIQNFVFVSSSFEGRCYTRFYCNTANSNYLVNYICSQTKPTGCHVVYFNNSNGSIITDKSVSFTQNSYGLYDGQSWYGSPVYSSVNDDLTVIDSVRSDANAFFLVPPTPERNQQMWEILVAMLLPILKSGVYLALLLIAFLLFVTLLGAFFKKFLM